MPPDKKIFIIAGEPSGDLHAAHLVRSMRSGSPGIQFYGLGGNLLRKEGVESYYDITDLALVGTIEVLQKLAKIREVYRGLIRKIDEIRPDLAILVDYPGFNLRIADALKRRGIPIVYFISPQVWAWGRNRIKIIRRYVDKIIVFFKFEEELYRRHGINVEFVGHPLIDVAKPSLSRDQMRCHYDLRARYTVAVLPGSRTTEVEQLLPEILAAGETIRARLGDVQFLISKASGLEVSLYTRPMERHPALDARLVEESVYNILLASDFAIVASGTATLECALIGTPMLIVYKASWITWALFRVVSRISSVGLVNIVAGKKIVPELLQFDVRPEKIAAETIGFLEDEKRRAEISAQLGMIRNSLGEPGAYDRSARAILALLKAAA